MPRGWYLAQGLIPLGYNSSDDDEGPCELPNGRLVCGPHGLVQCGRCCSDYSFMDDVLGEHREVLEDDEKDDEDHDLAPVAAPSAIGVPSLGSDVVRGTGLVFPSKFRHPVSPLRPMELFRGRVRFMNIVRYDAFSSSWRTFSCFANRLSVVSDAPTPTTSPCSSS